MAASFLVGLRLEGRRCLVIGDDADATRRAEAMTVAGAHVVQFGTTASDTRWTCRPGPVEAGDLTGAFVVVSTPRDEALSRWLFERATDAAHGFLLCCVDQPAFCTFAHVAVVRRGPLQMAVATDGVAPAVAAAIRRALDTQLGQDLGAWVAHVGAVRARAAVRDRLAAVERAVAGFSLSIRYELPVLETLETAAVESEQPLREAASAPDRGHNGDGRRKG